MKNNDSHIQGTVSVSSRALMQAIYHIANNTEGIYSTIDRSVHDAFHKLVCGNLHTKGVYVVKNLLGVSAEIFVILKSGCNAAKVCNEVSEKIKKDILDNLGIKLREVNILIHGFHDESKR